MARSQLGDVLLGDRQGDSSPWSKATGREYDIRAGAYGLSSYAVTVNRDRVGPGTTGWICFRDGSFGYIAGLCIFTGATQAKGADGIAYAPGLIYPLPREYWIDGARIQLSKWSGRAPFKAPPNRFRNGEAIETSDVAVLTSLLADPVCVWREDRIAEVSVPRSS